MFYFIINTCIIMLENILQNKRNKSRDWASIPNIADNGVLSCIRLTSEHFAGHILCDVTKKTKKIQNRNKTVTFGMHNHTYRWLNRTYTDSYS